MSTKNNFVGRLINRHMMIASATKGACDPLIKPILTPEIVPDHFQLNYPLQNNSDRIVSSAVPRSTPVRNNLKESPPTPYGHETRNKAKGNDELSSNSAMNKLRTPLESLAPHTKIQSPKYKQRRPLTLRPSFSDKDNNIMTPKEETSIPSNSLTINDIAKENKTSSEIVYKNHDSPSSLAASKSSMGNKSSFFPSLSIPSTPSSYENSNVVDRGQTVPELLPNQNSPSLVPHISPRKYSSSPKVETYLGRPSSHHEPTTVTINIGRIDVRALMPTKLSSAPNSQTQVTPSSSSSSPHSALTLREYLKQRSEGLF